MAYNFGLSECNRVKVNGYIFRGSNLPFPVLLPFSIGVSSKRKEASRKSQKLFPFVKTSNCEDLNL